MSALTVASTKEISSNPGVILYHLTTVNNGNTMLVPFEEINCIIHSTSSADNVYITSSGQTLTFVVAGGATPTLDVKVWGKR